MQEDYKQPRQVTELYLMALTSSSRLLHVVYDSRGIGICLEKWELTGVGIGLKSYICIPGLNTAPLNLALLLLQLIRSLS